MTIKELVGFTGKSERTIRTWIKKADLKGCEETAQGYVINYSIDEVEQILNAGSMSKDAVNILMSNARQELTVIPTNNSGSLEIISMFKMMMEQNQMFMTTVLGEIKNISSNQNHLQIEAPKEDYFSLLAYCSLHNIKTNRSELAMHGRELRKMAISKSLELKKIPDERWGQVNSYPVEILTEYFTV